MQFSRAIVLALLFVGVCAYAQDYQVTVSTVTVWVKATDKSGQPVTNLTQEDFEIFEDNARIAPNCFEEVRLSLDPNATPTGGTASMTQPKKFVLYLDLFNTSSPEYALIAPTMKDFLQQLQGKNVHMMAVSLVPEGKMALLSGFTNDMNRIASLLDQSKPNMARDAQVRNNEARIASLLNDLEETDDVQLESIEDIVGAAQDNSFRSGERADRKPLAKEKNARLMQSAIRMAETFANQERSQSEFSLRALEGFSEYISKQITREHLVVVYISGGFNADPGRRYFDVISNAVEHYNMRRDTSFNPRYSDNSRDERFNLRELVQQSVGKLNRMNVTLYAINTRGLSPLTDNLASKPQLAADLTKILPDYQESLAQIAHETGGISFENSQNFKVGFDGILRDIEHYYLLCYPAPEHKTKGQYHTIKIASKKPEVKLRHRNGYLD